MSDFRIISENSDEDIRRRDAEMALEWPYRALAANLLRVVRGAGNSASLLEQMGDVIRRSREYYDIVGDWPAPQTINEILRHQSPDDRTAEHLDSGRYSPADVERWEKDGSTAADRAVYKACRGALQMCASQLVSQTTQERAGKTEFHAGVRALIDCRSGKPRR